jgi:cyclomaltodextrin glucanotransferase
MMQQWNTETQLYRDIRLLSKLRRLNPAVSLGSQTQRYISEDVYCYSRCYRDSRCFVAMNKGYPVVLDRVFTNLEASEYTCMLTGRTFPVMNGWITGLSLASQEIILLNDIGDRVDGNTIIRAQLNGYRTGLGETVAVTGDCPELGAWDLRYAYRLEYINDNTWFGEIPFWESAGKAIAYKYVILRDGQPPLYENGIGRRWLLAQEGITKWRDTWLS